MKSKDNFAGSKTTSKKPVVTPSPMFNAAASFNPVSDYEVNLAPIQAPWKQPKEMDFRGRDRLGDTKPSSDVQIIAQVVPPGSTNGVM